MRLLFAFLALMVFVTPALPVMAAEDAHHADAVAHEASLHGEEHHKEVEGLPQLDPSSYASQIFWLAVTFALMHVIFKFKVIPDLSGVVDRRREQIESDLNAAHNLKDEAERVHAEYEAELSKAREKSSALYNRVENKIKEKQQEEYTAFQEKSSKEIEETEAEIAKATKAAMKDMNKVVAETASLAAERIAGVKADAKKAAATVKSLDKKKAA